MLLKDRRIVAVVLQHMVVERQNRVNPYFRITHRNLLTRKCVISQPILFTSQPSTSTECSGVVVAMEVVVLWELDGQLAADVVRLSLVPWHQVLRFEGVDVAEAHEAGAPVA